MQSERQDNGPPRPEGLSIREKAVLDAALKWEGAIRTYATDEWGDIPHLARILLNAVRDYREALKGA